MAYALLATHGLWMKGGALPVFAKDPCGSITGLEPVAIEELHRRSAGPAVSLSPIATPS